MAVLTPKNLGHRLIIQSFDMRPLQVLHREYPHVILGFLTDNKQASFESNIERLGFNPAFYNPNYNLVNEELVKKCHAAKMMIEPWTVNTLEDMKKMKALGVDGIITDYPNLFKDLQE
jgi:glycerophosphoryl diester phosphodiesterase